MIAYYQEPNAVTRFGSVHTYLELPAVLLDIIPDIILFLLTDTQGKYEDHKATCSETEVIHTKAHLWGPQGEETHAHCTQH